MTENGGTGLVRRVESSRTVNLGRGVLVPYPEPTGPAATKIAKANRRTGTKPEVLLRSALHGRGLRFRKDYLLRLDGVRVRPDIVFTRRKFAVFVDGCFWHSCPDHGVIPKSNSDYWVPKLQSNSERDRRVDAALAAAGWTVMRVWEHTPVDVAVDQVERELHRAARTSSTNRDEPWPPALGSSAVRLKGASRPRRGSDDPESDSA